MRERGHFNRRKSEPERCSLCGEPEPATDEGYTFCCNEPLVYPGEREYKEAKKEWESQ